LRLCAVGAFNHCTNLEIQNMNNTHLSRRVDNAKRDFEDIIDELIAEVEELECDKDKMQDEIDSLNATIEKMAERISELESA
jgi:peptidoglycan hydrolase CwlO-like protein